MTIFWFLWGLRFGRSSSPIIGQWMKAVSGTVLNIINSVYHVMPLIFIGATFREKLISHHQTMKEGCFWHCIKYNKFRLPCHAFDFYRGYVSGEAYLPSSGIESSFIEMFIMSAWLADDNTWMLMSMKKWMFCRHQHIISKTLAQFHL